MERVNARAKYDVSEEAGKLHHSSFVVDLHADTLLADRLFRYDMLERHQPRIPLSPFFNHVDVPRMKDGGVSLQAFGIVTNYWAAKRWTAERKVRRMDEIIRKSSDLEWALSGTEAEAVWKRGKIGAFLGMEGVHPLGGRVEGLGWFYERGLRYASLTHFNSTEAAYSSVSPVNKGLTAFGRELIGAMDEKGVIVDLAHINRAGFFEAIECSRNPVIVSHTTIGSLSRHPRAIDDEQIKAVAGKGGVIGIMFSPLFLSKRIIEGAERIVDHIDRVKEVSGIDYAALGSDFDGFIHLPRGLKDISDLPVLTQLMLDRGYSEEEIKKVLGLNFLRVYKQICG
ncbi:MAG: dipeptidase [Deltaproteobacteria bacterium]|nr:MAG: dipeptidase [Deltaproteobacteria bacterium]